MAQRTKQIWLGSLLAVAVVGVWAWRRSVERSVPTVKVHPVGRADLRTGVITSGKAEPSVVRELRAELAGIVSRVFVNLGDPVQQGAAIVELSVPTIQTELTQAAAELAEATEAKRIAESGGTPTQVAELQAQVNQARIARENASAVVKQSERLTEKGAIARAELDRARQALARANEELSLAEERQRLRIDPNVVKQSDARIKAAQAALDLAESRGRKITVRSPIAGTVYSLPVRVGDFADVNAVVARVGDLRRLTVRVFVDEPDLGKISLGQQVRLEWDGLPGKSWTGTVERKPVEVESRSDRTGGEVLASVDNSTSELLPNTNLAVEIITGSRKNVLAIPREALEIAGNSNSVFVVVGEQVEKRSVELGLMNPTQVEIVKGISEGDKVVVSTDRKLAEGQRVRASQ
jgi:HlyD family secretion protein